jgi:nucleotide-binding universal stress UspA family protein
MDHKDLEIPMYSHILIPTDGSSLSTAALEKGLSFARDARAKATILTITEPLHLFPGRGDQLEHMCADYARNSKEHAVRCLAEAEAKAKALHVPCEFIQLESTHPYQAIIDTAAERGCDLIAMASHGRRGVAAVLLGSETVKVLTHSAIPVLVYR